MSTMSDLLAEHTQLSADAVEHLQRVVAEWQLLADMSFADFLIWIAGTAGGPTSSCAWPRSGRPRHRPRTRRTR